MAITQRLSEIPTPPSRSDPANFDERADEFLGHFPTLQQELNTVIDQTNQTQDEINTSENNAYQHKENAYKWAQEAEDTEVNDGEHTGKSAYNWAKKAHKWANEAEDVQVNDGENQGYSAFHWVKKAEKIRNQTYQWANADEDTLVNDGVHQGYSAYHFYQKIQKIIASANFKGDWNSTTVYNVGDVVNYDGVVYLSLIDNNQGIEPGTDDTYWAVLGKDYDWDILDIQTKLAALTLDPVPYGIPYLDENGYIDKFVSEDLRNSVAQDYVTQQFSNISDFTFSANTVYQAQYNAVIYVVIGSSDVTLTYGTNNPPDKTLTLKVNNTICLFVPKGFYVQFSADTTAQILSKEVSDVFV